MEAEAVISSKGHTYVMVPQGRRPAPLTPREKDLVMLLGEGLKNKEIAVRMGLKVGTVKVYLHRLKIKDPSKANRYTVVRHALRDHERHQAIKISNWINKWGERLPKEALFDMQAICATMVASILVE